MRPTASSTPKSASTSPAFIPRSRRFATPETSSAEPSSRPSARPSAKSARRVIRSAPPWFQRRRLRRLLQLRPLPLGRRTASAGSRLSRSNTWLSNTNCRARFSNWSCPLPLADYPTIVMGHGGGGKLGNELVEHLFLPAFRNPALENLGDAAVLEMAPGARSPSAPIRSSCSRCSFPVAPSANSRSTVPSMILPSPARPKYLSAGFILEEGFPIAQLAAVVDAMRGRRTAGVADRHRRYESCRARAP